MSILNITKDNFRQEVLEAKGPVLVDFWATWCGPCQMIAPIVHEIAEENEHITVGKINVDEEMELAVRYGISSIPTLLVFENGQVTQTSVGLRSKEQIEKLFNK